jgi:UDP-N-acetylmuramate dehydrogenase
MKIALLDRDKFKSQLIYGHPLARYTSWRVGGPAKIFYMPSNLQDLSRFLCRVPQEQAIVWLGLGSNVLIRDGGINGLVIMTHPALCKLEQLENGVLRAEAGLTCAKLAKFCTRLGLVEGAFFAGIPGTMGGALAMNAGAFGGETWQHVIGVETIDRQGGIRFRQAADFKVGYREVQGLAEEWFVAGHFVFARSEETTDLAGVHAQTKEAIRVLLKKRADTQPIGTFNCGSVFRNPPGDHAARLIEACGLKGARIGGAGVSLKHANFIINDGSASAADLEALIHHVAEEVKLKQGVELILEAKIIGEKTPYANHS